MEFLRHHTGSLAVAEPLLRAFWSPSSVVRPDVLALRPPQQQHLISQCPVPRSLPLTKRENSRASLNIWSGHQSAQGRNVCSTAVQIHARSCWACLSSLVTPRTGSELGEELRLVEPGPKTVFAFLGYASLIGAWVCFHAMVTITPLFAMFGTDNPQPSSTSNWSQNVPVCPAN